MPIVNGVGIQTQVPPLVAEWLRRLARKREMSVAAVVRELLVEATFRSREEVDAKVAAVFQDHDRRLTALEKKR